MGGGVFKCSSPEGPDDVGEIAEVVVRVRIGPTRAGVCTKRQCKDSNDVILIGWRCGLDRYRGHSVPLSAIAVFNIADQVGGGGLAPSPLRRTIEYQAHLP